MILTEEVKAVLHQDQVLRPVLDKPYQRPQRQSRGLFGDLVSAIISQQVSTSAARTIHARLTIRFEDGMVTPQGMLMMSDDEVRACGVSRQKASYLQNIAQHFDDGNLSDQDYHHMTDDEIIEDLTKIKGVGIWTVQMILISTFQRDDVFPLGDLGIQNAMKDLYGLQSTGKALKMEMEEIANHWKPFRTYACLYLWNTLH